MFSAKTCLSLIPSVTWRRAQVCIGGVRLTCSPHGVPCPPFSHAGKQLGEDDERDLFPRILELAELIRPRAVMIENVRGLMDAKFDDYRSRIQASLEGMEPDDDGLPGYEVVGWKVYEAEKFGVPQLRPRSILIAFRKDVLKDLKYEAPAPGAKRVTVFDALEETMKERIKPFEGGPRAAQAQQVFDKWADGAKKDVAPTLVGGSKKHGGADLGPSRAKKAWGTLGVSGMGVANAPVNGVPTGTEKRDLFGADGPMLTVRQAAIIQGFPTEWDFTGARRPSTGRSETRFRRPSRRPSANRSSRCSRPTGGVTRTGDGERLTDRTMSTRFCPSAVRHGSPRRLKNPSSGSFRVPATSPRSRKRLNSSHAVSGSKAQL